MRLSITTFLLVLSFGCSDGVVDHSGHRSDASQPDLQAGPQLSGWAFAEYPLSQARVQAFAVGADGQQLKELGKTEADDKGAWKIYIGDYEGTVGVQAIPSAETEDVYVAYTPHVVQGQSFANIVISPMTTLSAALAKFHAQDGLHIAYAKQDADRAIASHFGTPNFHETPPLGSSGSGESAGLSTEKIVHLVHRTLHNQAHELTAKGYINPIVTIGGLTGLLATDMVRNGVFGRSDAEDRSSTANSTLLSGEVLRSEFALALLDETERAADQLQVSRDLLCGVATQISRAHNPLFASQAAPVKLSCRLANAVLRGTVSSLDPIQNATITAYAVDESGETTTQLATTCSGVDGAWELFIGAVPGPVLLEAFVRDAPADTIKRLLPDSYDIPYPVAVHLHSRP